MVDNPVNLADFGAALTSGDSQQIQAVLECHNVRVWHSGCGDRYMV